jgi:hypothetical protein
MRRILPVLALMAFLPGCAEQRPAGSISPSLGVSTMHTPWGSGSHSYPTSIYDPSLLNDPSLIEDQWRDRDGFGFFGD